ncbi:uncharacterized protein HD556DRAFT_1380945 [Suillus plorans]|uniref:Uncharacterized protein n=1 Tax=Suillus plorans TaxID=116603 RepID=A0A9P7ANK2_9AGAM|nr:uncharacterized protein HD556DRAFT_1380945 [Suillus plorans]KAG1792132.1 hypothetical protein HD556DRAFT_1380945 [Suillus plorans]
MFFDMPARNHFILLSAILMGTGSTNLRYTNLRSACIGRRPIISRNGAIHFEASTMRSRSYHRRISEDVLLSKSQSFPSKLSYDQCFVFGVPKIDLDHFGYPHVRSIKLEWDSVNLAKQ